MSFKKVHLRKLLAAFGSTEQKLVTLLRADIRQELAKAVGENKGGGDFHGPFWSDAKDYVLTGSDFDQRTQLRVQANKRRERLYPSLKNGFVDWWENKKRFNNEHIRPFPAAIKNQVNFPELDATVKAENFMGLSIGDGDKRLIYPYFSESPPLSADHARIGLWFLSTAFPQHSIEDFRILDVLRGSSFSVQESDLTGNEERTFKQLFARILRRWNDLREEY
jgi:hypothetical protein